MMTKPQKAGSIEISFHTQIHRKYVIWNAFCSKEIRKHKAKSEHNKSKSKSYIFQQSYTVKRQCIIRQ